LIGAHLNVMAAAIIRAPDQDAANAGFAHLADGDFLGRFIAWRASSAGAPRDVCRFSSVNDY
jgi:hypothetical protein